MIEQSKLDKAWDLFSRLQRQHPLWPSTFSHCDCGRGMARGAGKCHLCLREELAEHVGPILAQRADAAFDEVAKVLALIREEVDRRDNGEITGVPALSARPVD